MDSSDANYFGSSSLRKQRLSHPVTYIHFTLENSISKEHVTAHVINVSGRQRMLSQRIALFANRMVFETTMGNNIEPLREALFAAIDLMDESHTALA